MANSTTSKRKSKTKHQDAKPYDGFPLTVHPSGRWCKKYKGTQHYFGPLDNWKAALAKYEHDWPYIIEGETPPPIESDDADDDSDEHCTVGHLCNRFLTSKKLKMESGDLSSRTFHDYQKTAALLVGQFGRGRRIEKLQPSDFEKFRAKLAQRFGTVGLKNAVNTIRVVFKYGIEQRLIDSRTTKEYFRGSFDRPSAKLIRRARNTAGPRLFEAAEIVRILDALDGKPVLTGKTDEDGKPESVTLNRDPALRAMVLLGVNCGFGNTDLANLPEKAVDLKDGWVDFPRVKTEISRRIPLWDETISAMVEAIDGRPVSASRDEAGLCFLTKFGKRWVRVLEVGEGEEQKMVPIDALSQRFSKLLKRLKINGRRGLGFYTLRHVFQTIGGNAKDPDAVAAIMGHVDSSMGAVYREGVADDRLKAVVEAVHAWLWPTDEQADDGEANSDE